MLQSTCTAHVGRCGFCGSEGVGGRPEHAQACQACQAHLKDAGAQTSLLDHSGCRRSPWGASLGCAAPQPPSSSLTGDLMAPSFCTFSLSLSHLWLWSDSPLFFFLLLFTLYPYLTYFFLSAHASQLLSLMLSTLLPLAPFALWSVIVS